MRRLRLFDLRLGRLPNAVGVCAADISVVAQIVNTSQQRILYAPEAGDESWWGTWAEAAFNVSRDNPFITLPRDIARIESVNVCDNPVELNNQFYEYLRFGNGRMPKSCQDRLGITQVYERNNAVTFTDMTNAPQLLRVYISNAADENKRILLQGTDSNGNTIYSQDGLNRVEGEFLVLASPFVTTSIPFNSITGIQKDATADPVRIYQVDPDTGDEVLLHTMEPGEETASYRRYYLDSLPQACCFSSAISETTVQVRAIVKRELIPVRVDTDYTLIQNEEAIIEEALAARYSTMDTPEAKRMEMQKHTSAIRLLNGELNHYIGKDSAAINIKVFGSARLEKQKIGSIL